MEAFSMALHNETDQLITELFSDWKNTSGQLTSEEDGGPATWAEIDGVTFAINNIFLQIVSFTGIIVFTIILVIKLKSKTKWRLANAAVKGSQEDSTSAFVRDLKVVKMVTFISTVFIVCFFPISVLFVAWIVEPWFNIGAQFQNLHYFLCSFTFVMESISSSINIFIYYNNMSTKYRNHFRAMFCREGKEEKSKQ